MRALVLDGKLRFDPSYPEPRLPTGESLVRVRLAGICGTDLELARGYMNYRGVPGHEFVGEVIESARPELRERRVVGEINAACGRCETCVAGLGRHCASRTVLGILGRDGAFAEYLCLPNANLIPVPDSIPDDLAVFAEPLAAAYEIFEQLRIDRNRTILVLGDGRLGAIVALAMKAEGYVPIIAGHHTEKLAKLAALGVATRHEDSLEGPFDIVIDCTGSSPGFARAMALVRSRGTLILKSTAAGAAPLNLAQVVVNEITVMGSRCGRFGPALAALASGKVDPRSLLTATYPLADGLAAFEHAADRMSFKVVLRIF
jgi:threonine dehydrogenase-like Zn-dependent dehydrogenase